MATTRILLPSLDAAARVRFYADGLGLSVERSWDDPGNQGWLLRAGTEAYVEVIAANDHYPAGEVGSTQLVLEVAAVDQVVDRLRGTGATVLAEPADMPWNARTAQVLDPEGLTVNLFQPLP
jgi:predicted enzyme related to lactoylglutathione lyase